MLAALRRAVAALPVQEIDRELADRVPADALSRLAAAGVRGETYFPVPLVLRAKPSLLGYYRLLYGYSQKQFYESGSGRGWLKRMEIEDELSSRAEAALAELCDAFARAGTILVMGLGHGLQTAAYSNNLCLLTLGAQLRGSANNMRGSDGIKAVFAVLKAVFEAEVKDSSERSLRVRNAAGREVFVELSSDPDILIRSRMASGDDRTVVAIEVKAGEDHSNIWNRMGEAEKSHLKARKRGVVECWTIINDPQAPEPQLKASSPSTDRFYQLVELTNLEHPAHGLFASRVRDMVGL